MKEKRSPIFPQSPYGAQVPAVSPGWAGMDRRCVGVNDLPQFLHGQISCWALPAPAGPQGSVCPRVWPGRLWGSSGPAQSCTGGDSSRGDLQRPNHINDFPPQVPSTSANGLSLPRALHRGRGEEGKPRMSEFPGGISSRAGVPGSRATHAPGPGGCSGFAHSSVGAQTAAKSCTAA